MLTIAYSGKSQPTANAIATAAYGEEVKLTRKSMPEVDINWGRNQANSKLNPDISNVTNKRVMRELFAEHEVPMPNLYSTEDIFAVDDHSLFPVVGRPDQHSKKRGFWKCNTIGEALEAIKGRRRKKAATHFMEFVDSEREYRVHIFQGKSIRISEKVFNPDGTYTTGKPGDIKLRRVREAAKLAVSAVGLDFGAVDILARGDENDEVFVLEVNAAPGLGGSMPKLYADTFMKWKQDNE